MSIRKMIALHPDVKGNVNQPLGDAVHHAMYCAKMCLSCADACTAEKMDMVQCIRTCLDCAAECDSHDHDHCKLCAQICRECADDCRAAALSITPGA